MNPNQFYLMGQRFKYVRLLTITWAMNITSPAVCNSKAGAAVVTCLDSSPQVSTIIINCTGITTIEDHALSELRKRLCEVEACVAFLLPAEANRLGNEIQSELRELNTCFERKEDAQVLIFGNDLLSRSLRDRLPSVLEEINHLEDDFVKSIVRDSYKEFEQPELLESTPLRADGAFNARKIISDPKAFCWISVLLTERLQALIENRRPETNCILAVSLRASPFAAAIRLLGNSTEVSLEIIDHLGPTHEVIEAALGKAELFDAEFILVADFVVGGTEVKVARAFSLAQGAQLRNVVAIGAYLSGTAYDKNIHIEPLCLLTDVVKGLEYKFGTGR